MAIKEEEQKKNGMKIVDNLDGMKNATAKLNTKVAGIPKDLSYEDAVKTFEMSLDRPPKNVDELIEFFKNRKLNKATTNIKTTA